MRLTKIKEVNDFLEIVNHCKGEVTLTSPYGDKYNLKSLLTQYVAIAALLESMVMNLSCGALIEMMKQNF